VEVTEQPTDEKGSSTTTSISTETHSVTKNGVTTNSTVTIETTVEIRDGKRKTTVTRTEAKSGDGAKQLPTTTGATDSKAPTTAVGSSSSSGTQH
jgi:hypothetical protein